MAKKTIGLLAAAALVFSAPRALNWRLLRRAAAAVSPEAQPAVSSRQYFYEQIFLPFFVPDKNRPGVYRAWRLGDDPVPSFSMDKPAGTFRVFVVGGSIAANYRYARGQASLQAALRKALPSRKIEVLNCGMLGYDSYRERMLLEELVGYSPDLIVVMSGHNEKGSAAKPIPLPELYALDWLERHPAFLSLRRLLAKRRPERSSDDETDQVFAENLAAMLHLAKSHRTTIALCSPPINYRDSLPLRPIPIFDERFLPGWIAYLRGNCAQASRSWLDSLPRLNAAQDGDLRGLTLLHLGRCAESRGSWKEAREYYIQSKDVSHEWASPRRLALIEELGHRDGSVWIDLDGLFQKESAPAMPGLDAFVDGCHWRFGADGLVSLGIVEALRQAPQLADLPWDDRGLSFLREVWRKAKASDADSDDMRRLYSAIRDMDRPTAELSWRAVLCLERLAAGKAWEGGAFFERVRRAKGRMDPLATIWENPPWEVLKPRFFWHYGQALLLERKYRAAAAEFGRALALEPALREALLGQAAAYHLAGDAPAARLSLRKAAEQGLSRQSALLAASLGE